MSVVSNFGKNGVGYKMRLNNMNEQQVVHKLFIRVDESLNPLILLGFCDCEMFESSHAR